MSKRKKPFNVIVPCFLLLSLLLVLIIVAYPPAIMARYYLYNTFFILVALAASYIGIRLFYALYELYVLNPILLRKSQEIFSLFLPVNKVKLRIIYDDHSTKFVEASYAEALTKEDVLKISNGLHGCQALHPNENVWHGDWENFVFKTASAEFVLKFYSKSKKSIDDKKVVFFIGASKDAVKRFYKRLKTITITRTKK